MKNTTKLAAQVEPAGPALAVSLKWVASADDTEITLLVGGVRRGAILPWCDSITREPAGWTAVLATPEGDQDVRATHFWMTEEQAKVELLLALVARGVIPELQAAPIVFDLRNLSGRDSSGLDLAGLAQPRPADVQSDTVFVPDFGATTLTDGASPTARALALLDQARAALLAGGVIDLSIMLIQRDAAGCDTPVVLTTGLLGDRVRLAHAQQALDGLGGKGAAAQAG